MDTTISVVNIAAMLFLGLFCVFGPILLFFLLRKRFNLKFVPLLTGAAVFLLFALFLEQTMHSVLLSPDSSTYRSLIANPVLFMIYAGFSAGIFEESGRFIAFKLIRKKYTGLSTALSYGIGHGGFEAMMVVGLNFLVYAAISIANNTGNLSLFAGAQSDIILSAISEITVPTILLAGFERLLTMVIHISLSMLVWRSIERPEYIYLFPCAIFLHAFIDFAPALFQVGVITNLFFLYGFLIFCTLICAGIIYRIIVTEKKYTPSDF